MRVAGRIALWWVIHLISLFASAGLGSLSRSPSTNTVIGGVLAEIALTTAVLGLSFLLRRELAAQRKILGISGLDPIAPGSPGRALTHRHVRLVIMICIGLCVLFALAISCTPVTTTPR